MINVLSLFDGMSCGQIALSKLGVRVDNYYASEIDKWAIQVAKKNFPDMKHIGDVTKVKAEDLTKIDLLMGGSPCQGFSFAGKQLNFDDPRSALFFEFVRLLKECKPKYFLLENVRMKKEYQAVISEHLGVEPVMINSALVSAQNRVRLYWTNIPGIEQPEDKGIVLKDIIDGGTGGNVRSGQPQAYPRDYKKLGLKRVERMEFRADEKSNTVISNSSKNQIKVLVVPGTTYRKLTPLECERLQTVPDNYTDGVSNTQRYKMLGNGWTVDVISHILQGIND